MVTEGGLWRVQKRDAKGPWVNQVGRQWRVLLSAKLVRMMRSCWRRFSSGVLLTMSWVKLSGIIDDIPILDVGPVLLTFSCVFMGMRSEKRVSGDPGFEFGGDCG